MKRTVATLLALSLALTSLSGCFGKFALTRKVYAVNSEVKEKHLRSLVTWAFVIVPVYGVSALVDFILFNTIEFWSGSNPVAAGEKEFLYSEQGDRFRVKASKSGETVRYDIHHYKADRELDTMTIAWDLKTGKSTSIFKEFDRTTEFVAIRDKDGVTVQEQSKGGDEGKQLQLASYR